MSALSHPISQHTSPHSFHIPVLGLGYSIDTPLKVARYGIDSVVSIMDDGLTESIRKLHSRKLGIPYIPIKENTPDTRAKRITAYLDFLSDRISEQINAMKEMSFEEEGNDLNTYYRMLPQSHSMAKLYQNMQQAKCPLRKELEVSLREKVQAGRVDVNIMTKVDKLNYGKDGEVLPREYSDALAALRGFAQSKLESSVVFSAGMNPSLYSYMEQFDGFFPDENGIIKKGIILKVSDYRSALIQGKFLAKKGLWISEFRIESGLNCGGHAFAAEGNLLGPILEEFKQYRKQLNTELKDLCNQVLENKGKPLLPADVKMRITAQGGIGTAEEANLLTSYFELDGTGWGSPFLLVPEATSVDEETLQRLVTAKQDDFFISQASPLGVPFNNLKNSTGEIQRKKRIEKNRPGSPCYKKFLSFNKEYTEKPICTSSRQYLHNKLAEMEQEGASESQMEELLAKDCLCEGLGASAIMANGGKPARNLNAVTICPGPNLAYFKSIYSLKEMVGHIYGKWQLKLEKDRPNFFIKELQLNLDYFTKQLSSFEPSENSKIVQGFNRTKDNLTKGIEYYRNALANIKLASEEEMERMKSDLDAAWERLEQLIIPSTVKEPA